MRHRERTGPLESDGPTPHLHAIDKSPFQRLDREEHLIYTLWVLLFSAIPRHVGTVSPRRPFSSKPASPSDFANYCLFHHRASIGCHDISTSSWLYFPIIVNLKGSSMMRLCISADPTPGEDCSQSCNFLGIGRTSHRCVLFTSHTRA